MRKYLIAGLLVLSAGCSSGDNGVTQGTSTDTEADEATAETADEPATDSAVADLYVVWDDVGFSAMSPFGASINASS